MDNVNWQIPQPRQEQRIFMFLDMKNSTANVEQLGHLEYSKLIQACIHELSDLIIRYKAQVYQYVGDEIVLSWKSEKGLKDLNCINLFYAFQQSLIDQRDKFKKKFRNNSIFQSWYCRRHSNCNRSRRCKKGIGILW